MHDINCRMEAEDDKVRCWGKDPISKVYHDEEWGIPEHDDNRLFELIVLEGAQAGLSWITILKRRDNYRKAFDGFDPLVVASYGASKINELIRDEGIIRNRRKIESAINNAKRFLEIQQEFGSFDSYIWGFVDGKPKTNNFKTFKDMPAETELSKTISKDMKKRGFSFIGPTIMYAFMQSIGMVNDHLTHCFRWKEIKQKYGE